MKLQIAIPGLILALLLNFSGSPQSPLIDEVIDLPAGTYPVEEVLKLLEQHNLTISYSQAALRQKEISIEGEGVKLKDLLEQIFDLENYEYVVRRRKILVAPRAHKEIPVHSGFLNQQAEKGHSLGI